MKLKFKVQSYQSDAVNAVVECFAGQPMTSGLTYRMDPGDLRDLWDYEQVGFKNAELQISDTTVLNNITAVQKRQNLPVSSQLINSAGCKFNLDVEMETGTGKTYCYIKTIFEMNKRYGWSKFIIVVPSIAIREGVAKALEITAEHFLETYEKKARFFIYNSKQLHNLESFSSDAGINVMVINIQAFNATGQDNRRIYEELDDFQSRRPIDVISGNRPIVILDEPQKMEGARTLDALAKFKPLMILRYSATHRTSHNKIHRLDALDAYNQKLVKKINVRGITVKGPAGMSSYLYLEAIEISKQAPIARIELEVRQAGGSIKRLLKRLGIGRDLFTESNELDQYRGYVISQIDANSDTVEFTNGHVLLAGDATGDVTEETIRRIQIRETVKAHFEKEQSLFAKGIKVLSLFFIDEVAKYRDYSRPDEQGEYAKVFEEEYEQLKAEYLTELHLENDGYREYLNDIPVRITHNGYFSIDRKTKKMTDPAFKIRGERAGLSDDVDAYDLILKDKERLLSFKEPVRFIFSHSALREGWDNPNIFVLCMLKHSENTISRRQEVGRGLRLSVNQHGDRMDHPATVHDINVLTVVASESYRDFVTNLQQEISASLSARPRKADESYFTGKVIKTDEGFQIITPTMAKQIYKYLSKHDYSDEKSDQITHAYHLAKAEGTLAPLPDELMAFTDQIISLIDSVFSDSQLPGVGDDRKPKTNPLNSNFELQEFRSLWNRINQKAIYRVEFNPQELISHSIRALDSLKVTPLQYTIQEGTQIDDTSVDQIKEGKGFGSVITKTEQGKSINSQVNYDLIGKIAELTQLTRKDVADILKGMESVVFEQFKLNPEHFISEAARHINEQKAAIIIQHLSYDPIDEAFDTDIFTAAQTRQDFTKAGNKLKHHVYDYAITDSKVEREFVENLDTCSDVAVYAKLPRGFFIPTPVGDYNPDWAIAFKQGVVKHVYFVAETKGSLSSLELRAVEKAKIDCARKFFDRIGKTVWTENVKYDVVDSFGKLMEIVK